MKIKGDITMLVNSDSTSIEIRDRSANITFLRIELSPSDLSKMLSRLGHVPCELEINALDKIGKKHENKKFEFEVPEKVDRWRMNHNELEKHANSLLSDGWVSDGYFQSQDSFFSKDDKDWARCTIRRWV